LLETLSVELVREFRKGYSVTALKNMRKFYLIYNNPIGQSLTDEFYKLTWTHLPELAPCFAKRDIDCLTKFFSEHTNYTYLYTQSLVNSTYFEPAFEYGGMVIYEFVRNET